MQKRLRFRVIQVISTALIGLTPLFAQSLPRTGLPHSSDGAASFESNCAGCHGSDGAGGERAPDIARSTDVQQLSDGQLAKLITNGISGGGMPAFAPLGVAKISAIVAYLRLLQGGHVVAKLPGNPGAGRALFFGNAGCSVCHMINGKGGFMGADLTLFARDQSVDKLRDIIVDPDLYLSPESRPVTVLTQDGTKVTGLTRMNNNFSIALQTSDGTFHFLSKSCATKISTSFHSFMPSSKVTGLSNDKVNDLISYLISAARAGSQQSLMHITIANGQGMQTK